VRIVVIVPASIDMAADGAFHVMIYGDLAVSDAFADSKFYDWFDLGL
jgi:hypothetical protein